MISQKTRKPSRPRTNNSYLQLLKFKETKKMMTIQQKALAEAVLGG